MSKVWVLCIAVLGLGGCAITRVDPETPRLPLPDELPGQQANGVALPDPWWTLFGDSKLNELVEEALSHNPDVRLAAARVAEARATRRVTDANRLPSVDAEATATRSKNGESSGLPGTDREQTSYAVRGIVNFELDLWGKYAHASESSRAQLLNTEYGREAIKLSLTGDVARGYFGLIAASEQLARGRDTLASREEALRLEELRLEAGESDEFTVKRVMAEAAATRVSVHLLEMDVLERTNALGILLGRSPKDLVDRAVMTKCVNLPDAVMLPADLPSSVLARRPDIGAAEAALIASAADIGVARAQLFPSISLTGLLGAVGPQLSGLFSDSGDTWSAAGGLLQPLFQGGRLRANVSRTEAVREQRKAEYASTVQNAFREVLDSLQGQTLIAGARDANAAQVDALARATELAELRYQQGDIAYLDLLDVRRSLYQAQIDLLATQRDALLNTVDLALAVGGGLGQRAEPLASRR
jgi:outer membrane protein, multidrug efflux system